MWALRVPGALRATARRGDLRRGAGASGELALVPRSCQGETAFPRRRRSVGEPATGPCAIGSCAIAFPSCPRPCVTPVSSPVRAACQCFVRTFGRRVPSDGRGTGNGTPPAAPVNAPRLNDGVRLCGARVTNAPSGSHMSRARGSSVTPRNGP
ncbi:superfamily I DNA/RNA helicase [Streptomyces sp. OM5714]|nr:superfamily I DNA/RNA helicase [Streptomyces sp. OM5714]